MSEAAARALVDQWLEAQNSGDFAAYERLYAQKFEGVRRSGPRTVRLDRAGWLKDRRKMFQHKMSVEATDLKVIPGSVSAVVSFTQTWASGSYKDVGPKQLVLVPEGAALRLAREELLASTLVASKGPEMPAPGALAIVEQIAGKSWIFLQQNPAESAGSGPPALVTFDGGEAVTSRKAGRIPEALVGLKGQRFRLYDPKGEVCQATLKDFAVLGRVTPHFGQMASWQGGDGAETPPRAQVAQEAWDMAAGKGHALVGELEGGCEQARWARLASMPEVAPVPIGDAPKALEQAALTRFRGLPDYQKIAKGLKEEGLGEAAARWDTMEDVNTRVQLIGAPDGPRRLVAVTSVWQGGCGAFIGELGALWEVTGPPTEPRFALVSRPGGVLLRPWAAVDFDADGSLELLYETFDYSQGRGVLRMKDTMYTPLELTAVPFFDCPC